MIFRQLFDPASSTYSYLMASRRGGEALIIDPVLEKVDRYLQLIHELDLEAEALGQLAGEGARRAALRALGAVGIIRQADDRRRRAPLLEQCLHLAPGHDAIGRPQSTQRGGGSAERIAAGDADPAPAVVEREEEPRGAATRRLRHCRSTG